MIPFWFASTFTAFLNANLAKLFFFVFFQRKADFLPAAAKTRNPKSLAIPIFQFCSTCGFKTAHSQILKQLKYLLYSQFWLHSGSRSGRFAEIKSFSQQNNCHLKRVMLRRNGNNTDAGSTWQLTEFSPGDYAHHHKFIRLFLCETLPRLIIISCSNLASSLISGF